MRLVYWPTLSSATTNLSFPQKTQTSREGAALAAGKIQERGCDADGVNIVHHHVWILAVEDVDHRASHREKIFAETEFLFEADVQAGVVRKSQSVWSANQELLLVHHAEGIPRAVFKQVCEIDAPQGRRHCAPGKCAVRRVPQKRRALLRGKIQRAQKRIQRLIRVCPRAREACKQDRAFFKGVARGNGRAAVFVAPRGLQQKDAPDLSWVRSFEGQFPVTVARQQFHGNNRFFPDALLPAGAGDIEKRLLQTVRGHCERTGRGARDHRARGGIIERVHLLLVLRPAAPGKIQRDGGNSPPHGKFSAGVGELHIVPGGAPRAPPSSPNLSPAPPPALFTPPRSHPAPPC